MDKWPNFFIVGTTKAGTTALHEYLNTIPEIYMSSIKEPHYFSKNEIPKNNPLLDPIKDTTKYLSLYDNVKDEKIIGESSASYLTSIEAPNLIHKKIPEARILISLRDPVERAFSAYFDHIRHGRLTGSFEEEIKSRLNKSIDDEKNVLPLQNGLYFENVKRYLDTFSTKQVKIIIFEEWIKDVRFTIEKILMFLGIESTLEDFEHEIHNPYGVPRGSISRHILGSKLVSKISNRYLSPSSKKTISDFLLKKQTKPKMSKESRQILTNFYKDDVEKLKNLLGCTLPWPNFKN